MEISELRNRIFNISSISKFNGLAIEIFHYQYVNNAVYRQFVDLNKTAINKITHFSTIPFLPVEFFKSHKILCGDTPPENIFLSSGTSGNIASKHYITDLSIYEKSFFSCFHLFYGSPDQYTILALLPSYLERSDSSLVFMVDKLISLSKNAGSGFYLDQHEDLAEMLADSYNQKIFLIGVTFALLEFAEKYQISLGGGIVMETGGMKGRRQEIIREELHEVLKSRFGVAEIHSEYGMTELLSQAYSKGGGIFRTPPWMKVLIRDVNDPKLLMDHNKTGGINIIDLANIHSCSFIATQDLGRTHPDGSFEVHGRFDNSDIRGCNLMIS
ncbi:MAG: acyl transferase [Bacteroidetes bacterium]|nr:acyl transferase [Bacteroidota bacterium]